MSSSLPEGDPYEVLGVAHNATEGQINKAWRRKTKSIGPGSAEFAAINAAAELLLDPSRRRAYDAEAASPSADTAQDEAAGSKKRTFGGWRGTVLFAGVMALIAAGLAIWQGISYANNSGNGSTTTAKVPTASASAFAEIGRASCRERV